MRAGPLFFAPFALLALALTLSACGDATGIGAEPIIFQDTLLLAAPSVAAEDVPSALDIAASGFGGAIGGGRFPERPADAEQFDVAVRIRDGQLVLAPPAALGFTSPALRRAGITEPITDRSFEQIREAPGSGAYVTDRAVPVVPGAVYVLRSRLVRGGCSFFAKVEPVEISPERGEVRLHVVASTFCGDTRLTLKD